MNYRVGVVGCGGITGVHIDGILNTPNTTIVGLADIEMSRAHATKEKWSLTSANCYESLDDMLALETIDVLHVLTPHYLHVPMARIAAEKGIHAFVEKPPAMSMDEFDSLVAAMEKSGVRIGVCFQNRYNDAVLKIEELLKDNYLGKIKGARGFLTWDRGMNYYASAQWKGKIATEGGGVLMNQSIHTLDLMIQFLGSPLNVKGRVWNDRLPDQIEVEDTVEAYLTFADSSALFYATNKYVSNAPVMIEIVGERGTVRMEEQNLTVTMNDGLRKYYSWEGKIGSGKSYWGVSHGVCIADFYAALRENRPFKNDLINTKDTQWAVSEIYKNR